MGMPQVPNYSDKAIAEFLEAIRYIRSVVSAEACARVFGVSRQTITNWATAAARPGDAHRRAVIRWSKSLRKFLEKSP